MSTSPDVATRSRSEKKKKTTRRSTSRSSSSSVEVKKKAIKRRSRSRSRNPDGSLAGEGTRVHVGNLDESVSEHDLEDAFSRFGPIIEIWLASYAPFYAFVKFKDIRDANDAVGSLHQTYLRNCKMRVSVAMPRRRPGDPPPAYRGGYGGFNDRGGGDRGGGDRGYDRGGGSRGYGGASGGRDSERYRSPVRSPPRRSRSRSRSPPRKSKSSTRKATRQNDEQLSDELSECEIARRRATANFLLKQRMTKMKVDRQEMSRILENISVSSSSSSRSRSR